MRALLLAFVAAGVALVARPAVINAHPLDELVQSSFLTVRRNAVHVEVDLLPGARVSAAFFATLDANRDGQLDANERATLVNAVASKLSLQASGNDLTFALESDKWPEDQVLLHGEGMIRLFWRADIPSRVIPNASAIEFAYQNRFAPVASTYLVNALVDSLTLPLSGMSRSFTQQEFTVTASLAPTSVTEIASRRSVPWSFMLQGIHHVAIGFDHVLFVLALLLAGGRWQRIAAIVSAFTVAHSITLSLAVLGVVAPPVSIVEPAIAASVAIMGWRAFLAQRANQAPSEGIWDARLALTYAFGLLHGFGFASALMSLQLPTDELPWALGGFNVGVEAAQLGIVVVVWPVVSALGARARSRSSTLPRVALQAMSIGVAVVGGYWFIERAQ